LLTFLAPPTVQAAPYWGPDEVEAFLQGQGQPGAAPQAIPPLPPAGSRSDYVEMLGRTCGFLATWQVQTAGADFGGIREGEHLQTIIQTDNTSEAIWVWTRYYEWTGDNQYFTNIQNAFTYSLLHPAYNEEGGSTNTTGYYRMYNCGWAVKAEQKYREVYGDNTYKVYGDSCGGYLRDHTLIQFGNTFYDNVNAAVLSWAMGCLWWAGYNEGRADWMNSAFDRAEHSVKIWVEHDPTLLGNETWAMSGGATMWGLMNSYFRVRAEEAGTWVPLYIDQMDNFSTPGDFQNAWNGWYAFGHRAVGVGLSDPIHLATHVNLTEYLISEDGDLDGGIPARPEDTDAMDQTWVSNYLACFGCSELLSGESGVDALPPIASSAGLRLDGLANPARNSLDLVLTLKDPSSLDVAVHDLSGRRVALLGHGIYPAGATRLHWDGRCDAGSPVPAGVYLVTSRGNGESASRRVVLLR